MTEAQGPTEMEAFGEAKEAWLKQFLEVSNGISAHDTFGRVLRLLDPRQFEQCLRKWVQASVELNADAIIPIDGKTLCGSHDQARGQAALEMVSVWAAAQGLTLPDATKLPKPISLTVSKSMGWNGPKGSLSADSYESFVTFVGFYRRGAMQRHGVRVRQREGN